MFVACARGVTYVPLCVGGPAIGGLHPTSSIVVAGCTIAQYRTNNEACFDAASEYVCGRHAILQFECFGGLQATLTQRAGTTLTGTLV
jgi:hypothetical protein